MREIKTEIAISAPPAKVWSVLICFEDWDKWNPIVNRVSGSPSPGAKLSVTMKGKDGKDAQTYNPKILSFQAPKTFRWRAKMLSELLFANEKLVELEQVASGTRLVHRELFGGLLVPLFWNKLSVGVAPMLNSMNEALKKTAEKSDH